MMRKDELQAIILKLMGSSSLKSHPERSTTAPIRKKARRDIFCSKCFMVAFNTPLVRKRILYLLQDLVFHAAYVRKRKSERLMGGRMQEH